ADGWKYFEKVKSVEAVEIVVDTLAASGSLPGIDRYDPRDIWKAIEEKRAGKTGTTTVSEGDIKRPEWDVLASPNPPSDWPHFMCENTEHTRASYCQYSVVLPF